MNPTGDNVDQANPLDTTGGRCSRYLRYFVQRYIRRVRICAPPVLIVGCGHSGTSLLLAILGSHPSLHAIPYESRFAFEEDPSTLVREFQRSTIIAGKRRWVEKTPKHVRCIDRLFELCPGAKVLLMMRDGRDVACSIKERTGSIEEGIERWVNDNRAAESFLSHSSVYTVRYESLVTSFESTVRGILTFIGEPFTSTILEYHSTPKHYYSATIAKPPTASGEFHRQYRNWQINQPLFDGRGKWKTLSDNEKQLIKKHANELLLSHGYVDSISW